MMRYEGLMLVVILSAAEAAVGQERTIVKDAPTGFSESASGVWTREAREAASPHPLYEGPATPERFGVGDENVGPPGAATGRPPHSDAQERARQAFPEEWDDSAERDLLPDFFQAGPNDFSAASPTTFDSYRLNDVFYERNYPWSAMGKLFFSTRSGSSECSASVISRNDIVVTAAHCCFDRSENDFNNDFAFVPGTRNNSAPFGVFPFESARVLVSWVEEGDRQSDVCVLTMDRNSAGQSLSSLTGFLGRSWNFDPVQHHTTFGYPGNLDDGKLLRVCASESFAIPTCGGNAVVNTGCDQTFGASGGPWLRVYSPLEAGQRNFVNSVVSGIDRCTGPQGQVYNGPRFTTSNIVALCDDEGC